MDKPKKKYEDYFIEHDVLHADGNRYDLSKRASWMAYDKWFKLSVAERFRELGNVYVKVYAKALGSDKAPCDLRVVDGGGLDPDASDIYFHTAAIFRSFMPYNHPTSIGSLKCPQLVAFWADGSTFLDKLLFDGIVYFDKWTMLNADLWGVDTEQTGFVEGLNRIRGEEDAEDLGLDYVGMHFIKVARKIKDSGHYCNYFKRFNERSKRKPADLKPHCDPCFVKGG